MTALPGGGPGTVRDDVRRGFVAREALRVTTDQTGGLAGERVSDVIDRSICRDDAIGKMFDAFRYAAPVPKIESWVG